jgi:iron complex transport system ATP-binding protein
VNLSLQQISFSHGAARPLLEGVTLELRKGDFLGLIGPNGAGKSTLLQLAQGWLKPSRGTVQLDGKEVSSIARGDFARRVASVPQREEGAFAFSVLELVLMGRHAHGKSWAFESEADVDAAREALREVGLEGFEDRSVANLSGGERQRVLLARALAQETEYLLLDEPTASLDPGHQRQVFQLLAHRHQSHKSSILVILHDINLATAYCGEVAVLHKGRIVRRGPPADVLEPDLLREVYGIEMQVLTLSDGSLMVVPQR